MQAWFLREWPFNDTWVGGNITQPFLEYKLHPSYVVFLYWTLPSICHRTYFHTSKGHVTWIIKKFNRMAYQNVRLLARGHVIRVCLNCSEIVLQNIKNIYNSISPVIILSFHCHYLNVLKRVTRMTSSICYLANH